MAPAFPLSDQHKLLETPDSESNDVSKSSLSPPHDPTPALGYLGPTIRLQDLGFPTSRLTLTPGPIFIHHQTSNSLRVFCMLTSPTSKSALALGFLRFCSHPLHGLVPPTSSLQLCSRTWHKAHILSPLQHKDSQPLWGWGRPLEHIAQVTDMLGCIVCLLEKAIPPRSVKITCLSDI